MKETVILDTRSISCYVYFMTLTHTVEIPADYRIFIDLPRSVPSGVLAKININIPADFPKDTSNFNHQKHDKIDEIRQLLHKEMAEKGTTLINTESGDGWEAYIKERYV